jgi:hypothetical protein
MITQTIYPYRFHIGTQKAASTFLYNLLNTHPDVSLSRLTEINYFSNSIKNGVGWYLNTFKGDLARIDTSPKYFILGNEVAPRIKEYSDIFLQPNGIKPKFLLILRNPIDYLNSHFQMQKAQGYFAKNPNLYPKLTDNVLDFIQLYPQYANRARYAEILTNHWLKNFDLDQFKIVFFEELIKDRSKIMMEILRFWELRAVELEETTLSKNAMLRSPWLYSLQNLAQHNEQIKNYLKKSPMAGFIYEKLLIKNKLSKITQAERAELRELFKHDVEAFKKIPIIPAIPWRDFTTV